MQILSVEDAIQHFLAKVGEGANMPANTSDWDDDLDGWLLENINGPIALVRENGEIVDPWVPKAPARA